MADQGASNTSPSNQADEKRATILIVDDQEMVRTLVADLLTDLDYEVITASDGHDAIDLYSRMKEEAQANDQPEHPVDLVILDMILPKIDGVETFDRLRELNPDVRVILSSGYDVDDRVKELLGRGALGFIQKPYHIEALLNMVRKVLV
jgi:two-component system cell cycle sensor histidine kinase/response regulator CckA